MFNPIKYIKTNKKLRKDSLDLQKKLTDLMIEIVEVKQKSTAEYVVEKALAKKIDYYDIDSKKLNERIDYYDDAQKILNSQVFKNEVSGMVQKFIEHIAKASRSHEETQGIRMSINALELLKERLEDIKNPREVEKSTDNIYAPM